MRRPLAKLREINKLISEYSSYVSSQDLTKEDDYEEFEEKLIAILMEKE